MKQLVLATEAIPLEQEIQIRDFLGEHSYGFWHRLPNFWLVTVPDSVTTSQFLNDLQKRRFRDIELFVSEVEPARTKIQLTLDSAEWFGRHWGMTLKKFDSEDSSAA